MKKIIKSFKQISILLLVVSFLGCEDDNVVLPSVFSGFTYTLNQDTGTVTFINISENANTYEWTFGDGTTSTEINPIKSYENGTYTVMLKAKNVSGASNVFEDEITILIPEIATLPITFDGENTKYEATTFGGASFIIVDNANLSGANPTASKVGAIINSGVAFEGFYFDLGAPINLTTDKSIKALFWSNTPINILLKLEEGGTPAEATASHMGTGWEAIYFTFNSSASFNRFTMFVDGPGSTSGTFYVDDISQIATADVPCPETNLTLPIDFDCNGIAYTTKIAGNVSFDVIDNPELSGINNTESKVGKITNVGVNWENAFFNLDTPVDFTADKGIKMKFYSTQALPIKLKFEDGTAAPVENDQNHGGTGWEEITFTLTSSASYNDMILFVDGPGTASGTFYMDDIQQVSVAPPPPACTTTTLALPIDFDCDGIDYESKRVAGDIVFSIVDNPQKNGIHNVDTKVGQIVNIGNNWENLNFTLDTPMNFSTNKSIKLKLYSTQSLPIKLKVEGGGTPVENDQTHGGSGWEELTFTLATAETFTNIIIFIDGPGNATGTFYIDDIEQVINAVTCTDTTLELPIDFDCAGIDYESKRVAGDIVFSIVDNPQVNGIHNVATKVGQIVNIGNNWENLNFTLDTPMNFSTDKSIKLKLYSTQSLPIKLKVEGGGTPVENDQTHGGSGWEELTFTLGTAESFTNLIVFIDGPGNATGTFYIDDITQVASGGGGGIPAGEELITNGNFETTPITDNGWLLFPNGGTVELSTTVNNGGSNAVKFLAPASGGAPVLKQESFAINSVKGGDIVIVTFDLKADVTQPGAVINVALFSELSAGADRHAIAIPATNNTWQTVTAEITLNAALDVSRGLSMELQAACGAVAGCNIEMYVDNVSVKVKI